MGVLDGRFDAWCKFFKAQGVAANSQCTNRAWYFFKQSVFDGTKGQKSDGKPHFKTGDTLELTLDRTGPTGVLSLTVHDSVVAQIKGLPSDVALFPAVAITDGSCTCSFTLSEAVLGQDTGECPDDRSLDLAPAPSPAAESPDRAPSTYYGCRVQVKSTCALKGKCGRILSVASPATSAAKAKEEEAAASKKKEEEAAAAKAKEEEAAASKKKEEEAAAAKAKVVGRAQQSGPFKEAQEDELKKRRIVKARRSGSGERASGGGACVRVFCSRLGRSGEGRRWVVRLSRRREHTVCRDVVSTPHDAPSLQGTLRGSELTAEPPGARWRF